MPTLLQRVCQRGLFALLGVCGGEAAQRTIRQGRGIVGLCLLLLRKKEHFCWPSGVWLGEQAQQRQLRYGAVGIMGLSAVLVGVTSALAIAGFNIFGHRPTVYVPGACDRLEPHLRHHIVGQDDAVSLLADAVCNHLGQLHPKKPLVLSVHGPPGVGKSFFHQLLAEVLYNVTNVEDCPPELEDQCWRNKCPGSHCPSYKIVFGTDYVSNQFEVQAQLLKDALLTHVQKHRESVLVVEEYDKMNCRSRGMLQQLLLKGFAAAGIQFDRTIVVLESNVGYAEVFSRLEGGKQVSIDELQSILKDALFQDWARQGCESHGDTSKAVALIDVFAPFTPLNKEHIEALMRLQLQRRVDRLEYDLVRSGLADKVEWSAGVIDCLTSKVEFEGDYAIEGAKSVGTTVGLHVTRALKRLKASLGDEVRDAHIGRTLQFSATPDGRTLAARLLPQEQCLPG
eukprot:jgi/Chlat1/5101/Chrsp33S05115